MDKRTLAAYILECQPGDLLGFSQIGENHFKVIGPNGAVRYLTQGDLQRAALSIAGDTLARVIKSRPVITPKPETLQALKLKVQNSKTAKVQKGRAKK